MATTRLEGRRATRLARASASAVALMSMAAAADAATAPVFQPTLSVSATATDNAELASDDLRRSDLIGVVDAGVIVRSRGARVTLTGDVGAQFVGYARHTEPDRVLPRGHLDLNAILVERALFFDGEFAALRTRSDPLAAQSDTASTANTVSTVSLRASPYFAHDFSPTLSATARSDTTVTRNKSDDDSTGVVTPNGSTYQHDVVDITRKPTPFGFSIDGSHEDTNYQDASASVLRADSLQATLDTALGNDVVVGIVGGHERALYSGIRQDDSIYGALLQWHPSPRTLLDLDAEHHYFGVGWNLRFRDRLQHSAVEFTLNRTASASTATFGLTGPDSDPTTLLNGILSSRAPDAGSTDQAVDNLVQTRNLPTTFAQPLQITSESPQLATRATLNLIFNGVRNTVYASAYYQKAVALPGAPATPLSTTFDSRQWGGSLGLYHRLTPDVSAAAEVEWSAIEALAARDGESTRQLTGTLSLTRRLGPRTSLSCGLRHFDAHIVLNSAGNPTDVHENQAFAGLRVQY